jgi:hypothetical protein
VDGVRKKGMVWLRLRCWMMGLLDESDLRKNGDRVKGRNFEGKYNDAELSEFLCYALFNTTKSSGS